jgi:protein TonB
MKKALLFFLFTVVIGIVHAQQPTTPPPPPLPAKHADPDAEIKTESQTDTSLVNTNTIYTYVGHQPEFPGGMSKFFQYIAKNLKYPEQALKNGFQGKIFVSFVVEKDGSLTDIKAKKSVSPELDAEAEKLIRNCPKWKPGILNGKPVRVQYSLPINFELSR